MKILAVALCFGVFSFPLSRAQEVDDYLKEWNAKTDAYYSEWKKADLPKSKELTQKLLDAAVRSEHPEIVEEIAAGGNVAKKPPPN